MKKMEQRILQYYWKTLAKVLCAGVLITPIAVSAQQSRERPSKADWVKRLDKDGDSKVSKEEFDGPAEHFSQFDTNGDGYVEESEVPDNPPARAGQQGGQRPRGGR